MSKISLSPHASGTGNFTIASPATNTDRTLTLPDNTGTILTSSSNTNFPAGSVLQVVSSTQSLNVSTTSSSFASTGITASITPSSSSNKILIIVTFNVFYPYAGVDSYFAIYRGTSTNLYQEAIGYNLGTGGYPVTGSTLSYLDSPSTTSSTTYNVYYKSNGSNILRIGADGASNQTTTLIEIKG